MLDTPPTSRTEGWDGTSGDDLVGRDRERAEIGAWLDRATVRGGARVLRGDPGIGKSRLLAEAADQARRRGMTTLSTVGVPSESDIPFAGLHQLLQPLLGRGRDLTPAQAAALEAVVGGRAGPGHDVLRIGVAVLELIAAIGTPVCITADDIQWTDPATAGVLAFVARRIASQPVVIIAACRQGPGGPFDAARLPSSTLGPLDERSAAALLDRASGGLRPEIRQRLLADAAGSPLALVELPKLAATLGEGSLLPSWLPLTTRLQRAFSEYLSPLGAGTRALLLVTALEERAGLDSLFAAASRLVGRPVSFGDLSPALDAGLVAEVGSGLWFSHPLVRSAVQQSATVSMRIEAHRALARVLEADQARALSHRAAGTIGRDESIAAAMEAHAAAARRRAMASAAVTALERAAALSEDDAARGRRLLKAAGQASELGREDVVRRLVDEAGALDLTDLDRERVAVFATWYDLGGARRMGLRTDETLFRGLLARGDVDEAVEVVVAAALRAWWAGSRSSRRVRLPALALHAVGRDDPRYVAISGLACPDDAGPRVLRCLDELGATSADPATAALLGLAAIAVGAPDRAIGLLEVAADDLHTQGRLGLEVRALAGLAWAYFIVGDGNRAGAAARAAGILAGDSGQPRWALAAELVGAAADSLRGATRDALAVAERIEAAIPPSGATELLGLVQIVRGTCALADGRPRDAYDAFARVHDPGDVAYHPAFRRSCAAGLVESALHGETGAAASLLDDVQEAAAAAGAPLLRATVLALRPIVENGEDSEVLFAAALAGGLSGWPMLGARVRLGYGEWLRRRRRLTDARPQLRVARDAFEALGLRPLAERARQELRATGEGTRRQSGWDHLTAQELTIALAAARGLTNREIGRQLFLSHRTIGSHLYRIFPKLGITARSQLSDVLREAGDLAAAS